MNRLIGILLALTAAFLAGGAGADSTMRCDNRIASEGMAAASLLAVCGEPAYRDVWGGNFPGYGSVAGSEEWYYNFGPNLLLRVIRLRDGKIAQIDADGYGFSELPHPPCEPSRIVEGLSKYRLILQCGQPLTQQARWVSVPLERYGRDGRRRYGGYYSTVFQEEWIYNFGSRYLMRVVRLENGRVVDVQNGDRGAD
jgi:hypothetical protein